MLGIGVWGLSNDIWSAVLVITILFSMLSVGLYAQNKILDGVYIKENTPTRRVIPLKDMVKM